MKFYLLSGILLMTFLSAFSQKRKVIINGIVTDEANNAIPEVFISINWSSSGLLSCDDGSFYLRVSGQDTIVFKHTSFEPKVLVAKNLDSTDSLKIQLTERTLQLNEVQVTNWGNWEDFRHKIATMNADSIRKTSEYQLKTMFNNIDLFPEDKHADRFLSSLKLPPSVAKQLNPYGASFAGIGIGLNKKGTLHTTKEKKIKLALKKNAHRYSLAILSKIVKIKGKTLKEFKEYCDYFIDFKQNDYELITQIKRLYNEWKSSEVFHSTTDSIPTPNKKHN